MLSPAEVFPRLVTERSFDDPTMPWYPCRWYFNEEGIMCCLPRGFLPTRYPDYRDPKHSTKVTAPTSNENKAGHGVYR